MPSTRLTPGPATAHESSSRAGDRCFVVPAAPSALQRSALGGRCGAEL